MEKKEPLDFRTQLGPSLYEPLAQEAEGFGMRFTDYVKSILVDYVRKIGQPNKDKPTPVVKAHRPFGA